MKVDHIKKQLIKATTWEDETGLRVQTSRLTKLEKLKEVKSYQLMKEAHTLHEKLAKFKEHVKTECQHVYDTFREEIESKSAKKPKGNFTWYNFDRSIKIEVSVSESITFDDLGINECKAKLDEFLTQNIDAKTDVIKDLVMSAFDTSRGKLDSRKVMGLLKYESKIKHKDFQIAMKLLKDAIRRPKSRTYFRVSVLDENGAYQAIDLNLSSINE